MSIRTIVEINHDLLSQLDDPEQLKEMLISLSLGRHVPELNNGNQPEIAPGVRVLLQRHHSDEVTIKSDWSTVKL